MNPVIINDRIARYDYIPLIERSFERFQDECYKILTEKWESR